jgi:hypothetical protein
MPHFRLLKADSPDDRETRDADCPDQTAALLEFGRQLGVELSLNGDAASDYLMQSRTLQEVNFAASKKLPVYVVRS